MFYGLKEIFEKLLEKAEDSFKRSNKGLEDTKILIRYWGIPVYLFFFFVVRELIFAIDFFAVGLILSSFVIMYCAWHIFALIKCKPKKVKLTKEQKLELKKDRAKRLSKSFVKKLLLQESISKWDPISITIAVDVYFILLFVERVI
jgi:hypothetical protein